MAKMFEMILNSLDFRTDNLYTDMDYIHLSVDFISPLALILEHILSCSTSAHEKKAKNFFCRWRQPKSDNDEQWWIDCP